MISSISDQRQLRQGFSAFPTGVVALAALVDGSPHGLAASSFTSISLDPPLVGVALSRSSNTWPVLREAPRLGVSVLGHQQSLVCRALAGPAADRFAGLMWRADGDGAVTIDGSVLTLVCSVASVMAAGDHEIALLEVHEMQHDEGEPLVFHGSRFRRLAG